jgi:hypothetical protein
MSNSIEAELQTEINKARKTGAEIDGIELKAVKAWYAADTERIFIELNTEIIMDCTGKVWMWTWAYRN